MATPPEVLQLLQQLEPILARWYNQGEFGEVAIVFGRNEMALEKRPREVVVRVKLRQTVSRAKAIGKVG